MLSRNQGQIVAISSLAAYRGFLNQVLIVQARLGCRRLLRVCESTWRNSGVDVTIIHPGFIKTPLTTGRHAKMPFLMELPDATSEDDAGDRKRRRSYSFPWQLAAIVKLGLVMPAGSMIEFPARNSFRE